jgi:hypothetical protein
MTSRLLAALLAASVIVVTAAACDEGTVDGYYDRGRDPCGQYASCGACTPVLGCGWCTTGVGQGLCASDPDECASAPSFSWTWNASGCFAPADAGIVETTDSGLSTPAPTPTDAGATLDDAARPSSGDAGTLVDASDASTLGD